jgi:integrase
LTRAVKWGLLSRNPAALVDVPQSPTHEIRPFDPDQARQFLAATAGHRWEALFTAALALGLRQGEALALRWQDADLDAAVLDVRQTLQRVGGDRKRLTALRDEWKALRDKIEATPEPERIALQAERKRLWGEIQKVRRVFAFGEPKSASSRRSISIPPLVVKALRTHRVRQLEERLAAGGDWKDMGLIFSTHLGTPIDPRAVTAAFHKILTKAGLPSMRYHDLRHSCATLLLAQGVSPRTVMATLGHSQISLTLDVYAHVLPEMQQDAAVRMDRILTGAKA